MLELPVEPIFKVLELSLYRRVGAEGEDRQPPDRVLQREYWEYRTLLSDGSEVLGDGDALPAGVVDPEDDHPGAGGGRGEDHHGGVVHADDGGLVSGRQSLHHRHQEHGHVQHRLQ